MHKIGCASRRSRGFADRAETPDQPIARLATEANAPLHLSWHAPLIIWFKENGRRNRKAGRSGGNRSS